jgi:uncharacterized protein YbjT (DUF2867 family)
LVGNGFSTKKTLHAVTGAFGFTGKYIAGRLLSEGRQVVTLTDSPKRSDPFGGRVAARPFHFDDPPRLVRSLQDVSVLYNTYWVRFNSPRFTLAGALQNTQTLFESAKKAGVARIVHISITNASEDSDLEYFRGKGEAESALRSTGISHAILRPAVLFGKEDILLNNIAWILRRFPVFGIFGDGKYRLQPIFVGDLAEIAVQEGASGESTVVQCIGPETFRYRDLVKRMGELIRKPRPLVSIPPVVGYAVGMLLGKLLHDVIITRDEIEGLMREMLYVEAPASGKTALTGWIREHADSIGRHYAGEMPRRENRTDPYPSY